jgi:hypothetical protein
MGRILYQSTLFKRPAGGVRTIFRHVAGLRALGWDAAVLSDLEQGVRPSWFQSDVPVISTIGGLVVWPDDVIVYPEVAGTALRDFRKVRARKALFCQNQYALFNSIDDTFTDWADYGVTDAIYCSETVKRATERCFSFTDSAVVRCLVDRGLFRPAEKRMRVVFMARKRPTEDITYVRRAFERMWPQYADYPWFGLQGRSEAEVAQALGEGAVFLSLGLREGLGLPPLEAMSAGCIVAGFTGVGGDEYATPENGFWSPEEDFMAAADAVGRAIHLVKTDPEGTAAMRQAGSATVDRYSAEGMVDDLAAFWTRMMGPPPNPGSREAAIAAVLA